MKRIAHSFTFFAVSLMLIDSIGMTHHSDETDVANSYHIPKTTRVVDKSRRPRPYSFEASDTFKAVGGSENDKEEKLNYTNLKLFIFSK